jgi:hypothetical protein
MSQRIVTLCDMHGARDEDQPGSPYDLAIRVGGKRFEFVTVDLCESCAKGLVDVFAEISQVGRPFDGDPTEAVAKRAKHGVGRRPLETNCPECGHDAPTRSALRSHVTSAHGQTIGELEGSEKSECPECHREFAGRAALGSHMRVHQ